MDEDGIGIWIRIGIGMWMKILDGIGMWIRIRKGDLDEDSGWDRIVDEDVGWNGNVDEITNGRNVDKDTR